MWNWPNKPKATLRVTVTADMLEAVPERPIVRSAGAERARRWREENVSNREIVQEIMGR
jgi:hypothetical protein